MAYALSSLQGFYIQEEASFGIIPNSSGTATLAGSNACRIISATMKGIQGGIDRPDKTPSLSRTVGVPGKRSATGLNVRMSMAGNGAAGVVPDCDKLLKSAFGKAPVITASTKVQYDLDDNLYSLSLWSFRKPSTVTQQVALGSIVQSLEISIGQDVAELNFGVESLWVLDTDQFATVDSVGKGGLTAYPSEPASPVTNGNMVVGFLGQITLDGNVYSTVRPSTIRIELDRELPKDVFNSYYSGAPGAGIRTVTLDTSLYDDDSANLSTLKGKAYSRTPITAIFQIGNTAGNTWKFTLRNLTLPAGDYDDSQRRFVFQMNGAQAHATTGTSKDEITLEII